MGKASKLMLYILSAVLVIFLAACSDSGKEKNALINPPDTSGNPVEAFGVIKSCSTKIITAGIPAKLTQLKVTEGQKVKNGDILAVLDLTEYRNRIARLEAEYKNLEMDLQLLRQNYEVNRKMFKEGSLPDIKKLSNNLSESVYALTEAQKTHELKKTLYASGSISLSDLKDIEAQAKKAENASKDIALSIESLKSAKKQELDAKASEIAAKEDKLHTLDIELDDVKLKLNSDVLHDSQIICNLEQGVVSEIICFEGASINPAESIFKLMDMSSLVVEANVDEQFISMIEAAAHVVIIPDADRTHLYTGKVSFISSIAVTSNGETTIPVKITIDKPDPFLIPGLNVSVKIDCKDEH